MPKLFGEKGKKKGPFGKKKKKFLFLFGENFFF